MKTAKPFDAWKKSKKSETVATGATGASHIPTCYRPGELFHTNTLGLPFSVVVGCHGNHHSSSRYLDAIFQRLSTATETVSLTTKA
jgi:hypothetical protein